MTLILGLAILQQSMEFHAVVLISAVFFIVIIHLTDIYWAPSMCQALSDVMGIQQRTKREKPYSQVAYILLGSAGNIEPGMQ